MKRFVLLGSAVSVLDSFEDLSAPEGKPYSEDDWNPVRFLGPRNMASWLILPPGD